MSSKISQARDWDVQDIVEQQKEERESSEVCQNFTSPSPHLLLLLQCHPTAHSLSSLSAQVFQNFADEVEALGAEHLDKADKKAYQAKKLKALGCTLAKSPKVSPSMS